MVVHVVVVALGAVAALAWGLGLPEAGFFSKSYPTEECIHGHFKKLYPP